MRLFFYRSNLYLSIIFETNQTLTDDLLFHTLRLLIPSLKKKDARYTWASQNPSYRFLYLTFEKMRGPYFTSAQVKKLEKQFIQKIQERYEESKITSFWPYNHEEGYRQLLLLRNEIQSKDDLPHVWIQFHNRTDRGIAFMIYLIKPYSHEDRDLEIMKEDLSQGVQMHCYLHQEIDGKIPVNATIFSLTIPYQWTPFSEQINTFDARERIVQELSHSIGPFRDFNGGLLETQKKRFSNLVKQFSHQILNLSLFCKPLFYGIYPIEKQLSLNDEVMRNLFYLFSEHLEKNQSISRTEHLLILRLTSAEEISFMISKCRSLQQEGKITAYAHVTICLREYFCIIDETTQFLMFWQKMLKPKQTSSKSRVLRLAFRGGTFSSFSPYYLGQDTRGYTLASFLFESLFRLNPQGQIIYAGAESMEKSEDQKRYTFKIRSNYWSNGEEITAFDYEKAWQAFQGHQNHHFFDHLTVCALDANFLQVNLSHPDPFFLQKLTHPIFSPISYKEEPSEFNGPYVIKQAKQTDLILEKTLFIGISKVSFLMR